MLRIEAIGEENEQDAVERGVSELLSAAAGRQLLALVTSNAKRSRLALVESVRAVADGVLRNLFLVALSGVVADDSAIIDLLARLGLPTAKLPPDHQVRAARLIDAGLGACLMEELVEVAEGAPWRSCRARFALLSSCRKSCRANFEL